MIQCQLAMPFFLAVLLAGCVFDSDGLPGADGSIADTLRPDILATPDLPRDQRFIEAALDATPDVTPDLTPDLTPDVTPDITVDPECLKAATIVCRFGASDSVGQTGKCVAGKFTLIRHCYADAKCNFSGICAKGCSSECIHGGCGSSDLCVPFKQAGNYDLRSCCAKSSKNGPKKALEACTKHTDCANGICTDKGNCIMPCTLSGSDSCKAKSLECSYLTATLGGVTYKVKGCVKPTTPDGGPDTLSPPDATPDTASPPDAAPDTASPPDATPDTQSSPDAAPDVGVAG